MKNAERRRIEAKIERLIQLLDHVDGDPDLEPEPREDQGDDELSEVIPAAHIIARVKDRRLR